MKGFYQINWKPTKEHLDCVVLFKAIGNTNSADLIDALKDSLRIAIYPDLLLIVTAPSERNQVESLLKNDPAVLSQKLRAEQKVAIGIANISKKGLLTNFKIVLNKQTLPKIIVDSGEIYAAGLQQLFCNDSVVIKSPPGFIFLKPSGGRSTYFLRAESALYDSENVHFLACALLYKISSNLPKKDDLEVILIDTMAIASLAYLLRDLLLELGCIKSKPRVVSFHSYEGLGKVGAPLPGTSLCLISASSSMSMERNWKSRTKCNENEVVTLVTLSGSEDANCALFKHPKSHFQLTHKNLDGLRDLRIVGENFSPEEISPKEVLLLKTVHKSIPLANCLPNYSDNGVFRALSTDPSRGSQKTILVDAEKLVSLSETKNFFKTEIRNNAPVGVSHILHQSDSGSTALALYCAKEIKNTNNRNITCSIFEDVGSLTFKKKSGLLIVAAVAGRGNALLSLNRTLRDMHIGPRQYLIAMHVSISSLDTRRLKSTLIHSGNKWKYKAEIMRSIAFGINETTAGHNEIEILSSLNSRKKLPIALRTRLKQLQQNEEPTSGAFLPPPSNLNGMMLLRKTFALWDKKYSLKKDHSGGVLATIASTLQNARELDSSFEEKDRLNSDSFQQVLLKPENFARYNDGIIQAALLRCSKPQELDYSSQSSASFQMKSILLGIFSSSDKGQGEAALEFALAIACDKLRLVESDMKDLKRKVGKLRTSQLILVKRFLNYRATSGF